MKEQILLNQIVQNCLFYIVGAKLSTGQCPGAKLSGCQIVRFYFIGDKLSDFSSWCQIVRLPSWCQIVRSYFLGAKLSRWQIVRCQIVGCKIVLPHRKKFPKYLFTRPITYLAAGDVKIIIFSSTNIEKPEFCVDHISISVLHTDQR